MSVSSLFDSYPYAKDYLFNHVETRYRNFPKHKFRRLLKGLSRASISYIDDIAKWKNDVERGLITTPPVHKLGVVDEHSKHTLLNNLNGICILIAMLFVVLIAVYAIGPLEFVADFKYIALYVVIALLIISIRFFVCIGLCRRLRFYENALPYAFSYINKRRNIPSPKELLFQIDDETKEIKYLYYARFEDLLMIDVYLWAFHELLKRQIDSVPEQIYKYYYQTLNERDYANISYGIERYYPTSGYRNGTSSTHRTFCNVFNLLLDRPRNAEVLEFLMNIIVPQKLEAIASHNDMQCDKGKVANFKSVVLADRAFRNLHVTEYGYSVLATEIAAVIVLLTSLSFYPVKFRYDYVKKELTNAKYDGLMQKYEGIKNAAIEKNDAKYLSALQTYNDSLAKLGMAETVNLIVEVRNIQNYNDHVGNSWYTQNTVNGEELIEGGETVIPYQIGKPLVIKNKIVENDNYPDVDVESRSLVYTKEQLMKGVEVSIESRVVEDRGRYAGNSSGWTSAYSIKMQKPVPPTKAKPILPPKPKIEDINVDAAEVINNFLNI